MFRVDNREKGVHTKQEPAKVNIRDEQDPQNRRGSHKENQPVKQVPNENTFSSARTAAAKM